jgi:isoleucyl-tRNA synthetase
MSTVLERTEPMQTVLGHGLVRDEHGEEMHKSKGNAIWFDDAAEKMGVDVMRWLFLRHNPALNVNFGYAQGDEIRRSLFLTLWNTYAFFVTYARIDGWQPDGTGGGDNELDRWLRSELHQLIDDITTSLEQYDTMTPCRRIEAFVEDLSNWYVRRSRRRFWKSEDDADKQAAYATLHEALVTLAKLLSPIAPFLADDLYQNLVRSFDSETPASVHLCAWPAADHSRIDTVLNDEVRLVMRLASLGRSARAKAKVKVRQPLPRVFVKVRSKMEEDALPRMEPQLLEELNVKQLVPIHDESDFLRYEVKPNLPVLGPKLGPAVADVRKALEHGDGASIAADVAAGRSVELAGHLVAADELLVTAVEQEGFASAQDGGYVVVVDTNVPEELRDEGLAREIVHRIQNLRRDAGFEISDRIVLHWQGDKDVERVLRSFDGYIRTETLSRDIVEGAPPQGAHSAEQDVDGHRLVIGAKRA